VGISNRRMLLMVSRSRAAEPFRLSHFVWCWVSVCAHASLQGSTLTWSQFWTGGIGRRASAMPTS